MLTSDLAKTLAGYSDDDVFRVFKRARVRKSSADVVAHHLSVMELTKRGKRMSGAVRHTDLVEIERVEMRAEDLPDDMAKTVSMPDLVDMVTFLTPTEYQIVIEPIDDDLWDFETPFKDNEAGGYEEARKAVGLKVGDLVMCSDDNSIRGRVEHIMTTGHLGWEGSPMSIEATPSDPAILVRIFERTGGTWEETNTFTGRPQSKVIRLTTLDKAKSVNVGDFVSWNSSGGTARGEVVRIVKTGTLDVPDSSFTLNADEDNPAVLIRLWRTGPNGNTATGTMVGHRMKTLRRIQPLKETLAKRIEQEGEKWCVYAETTGRSFGCYPSKAKAEERLRQIEMFKADTPDSFAPPTGVRTAARRAVGWIEDGKAGSGFTATGRRRASQLAAGDSVSLDTIQRMRSFFARHTPDKKATGFSQGEEGFPSAGRVAWDAWGGDVGESWANRMYDRYAVDKHVVEQVPTTFFKSADEERRYTMGPMYIPNSVDAQGEWTDEDELQQAVWQYVREGDRRIRLQHNRDIIAGEWVEVLTWPFEVSVPMMSLEQTVNKVETMTFPKNTVFLGVVWEPWAWDLVKQGLLRGYSIGGNAARVMADLPEA